MNSFEFEITIQSKSSNGWPIVIRCKQPDGLTIHSRGILQLGEEDFYKLTEKQENEKEYGILLGKHLFRDNVRDTFLRVLPKSSHDCPLRILLSIEAADRDEIRTLHWERLCAPVDNNEGWNLLARDQRLPFSRYIPTPIDRRFPLIGRRDLRALVLIASPSNLGKYQLEPFDVKAVLAGLQEAFGDIHYDVLANDVENAIAPPTLQKLSQQLTNAEKPYTILHFVCHGKLIDGGETVLYWAEANNQVLPVTGKELLDELSYISDRTGLPHFTFLCTCESADPRAEGALGGLAQRLVRDLGMPAVVAMTRKVSVETALTLSGSFYRRLKDSGEVDVALQQATAGLGNRYDITVPALFSRLGGRPLFSDRLDNRDLTDVEVEYGINKLQKLLVERAPHASVLQQKFATQTQILKNTQGADSRRASDERKQALAELNNLCDQVLDLSFDALAALDKNPPKYEAECPFPGLSSFAEENYHKFFFERDELIKKLQKKLSQDNFLAVIGPSGSGKSSVVLAGLIPQLQKQQPNLQLAYIKPGKEPIQQLENLSQILKQNSILIVDQFEELFTLCEDKTARQKFITELLNRAEKQQVVITIRADFLAEYAAYPDLKKRIESQNEIVLPMEAAELITAMKMQADRAGLRFEAGLSNSIFNDVKEEPGAMPLLQYALQELWKRRHGRWLCDEEYQAIGRVQQAIAQTADAVYNKLSPQEQQQVKNIFLRLTRLDATTAQVENRRDTRRREELKDLVSKNGDLAVTKKLVQYLAGEGARLVVTSYHQATGKQEVEVAHEALIRHWPKLQNWLEEDRSSLLLREKIRQEAFDWNQHQRNEDYLELRGIQLENAQVLLQKPDFLNESEAEYVKACWELRLRLIKQEEERRQRELKQARRIAIGSTVAAAITIVLASLAGYAWQQSKRQQAEAYAQTGKALLATNPTEGLVNAIASVGLTRSPLVKFPNYTMPASVERSLFSAVQISHEINIFQVDQGVVDSVAISSDSKTIVSGGKDGTVRLWGINGQPLAEPFKGHQGVVDSVAISSDGKTIVSGGDDGTVRLWGINGQPLAEPFKGHQGVVFSVAISSDGKTIVSGGQDGTVRLWDRNGQPLAEPFKADQSFVRSVAISSDGKTIVSGGQDGTVRLWDRNGQPLAEPFKGHQGFVRSVAISSDGKTIVSGGDDGTLRLWDRNGQPLAEPFKADQGSVFSVAISSDGKTIVSGGDDGTVRLWDRNGQPLAEPFKADQGSVDSVAISSDGKTIVIGEEDGTLRLWGSNAQPLAEPFKGYQGSVRSVAISSDGKTIVSSREDGTLRLWGSNAQPLAEPFKGHQGRVSSVAISSDGKTIVSGGFDGTLRLWGSNAQPLAEPFKSDQDTVLSVAISSDGKTIVSGGSDGTLRLWDRNGQPLAEPFKAHQGYVFSVAISSDGKTIVSGGSDGTLRLWDRNGQPLAEPFKAHQGFILPVAISSDGKTIVSGGEDDTLRLWDRNGQPLAEPFKADQDGVKSVAISSDGKTIISGGDDGTVRLWDINFDHWMKSACEKLRYHVILATPKDAVAKEAKATCEQYWHLQQ
ncbi:WD-40 repeat-containing protein [Nostoc sp. HK-01]|nr:WD-40 repeat-containing protein [Nostoc sp. HK-01]